MVEPPPTHGYLVADAFLGNPQVLAALREADSEVAGKLEGMVGTMFKSLRLTEAHFEPAGEGTRLGYEAIAATQKFYEDPVAALKNAGVIKSDAEVRISPSWTHSSDGKFLGYSLPGLELYIEIRGPDV